MQDGASSTAKTYRIRYRLLRMAGVALVAAVVLASVPAHSAHFASHIKRRG